MTPARVLIPRPDADTPNVHLIAAALAGRLSTPEPVPTTRRSSTR